MRDSVSQPAPLRAAHELSIRVVLFTLVLGAAAGFSATVSFAAEENNVPSAGSSDVDAIVEIVVTARKRSENLRDIPASITVISAATLEDAHVTQLDDLNSLVTNLNVVEAHDNTPDVTLRGVGGKIADCVLLFAYGFDSAFPVDVWVERALQTLYFPKRRAREKKLRHFAATHACHQRVDGQHDKKIHGGADEHEGQRGVDEIADRVVRSFQHAFDIDQLEEDHQPNRQDGVVGGPHVGDVVIHLVRHEPKLLKDQPLGDFDRSLMAALRSGGVSGR